MLGFAFSTPAAELLDEVHTLACGRLPKVRRFNAHAEQREMRLIESAGEIRLERVVPKLVGLVAVAE